MRVSRAQMAAHHEQIVDAAAALFRAQGLDGVGVDAVMRHAGLTHGGFYRHFPSKEALVAEAVERALAQGAVRQARFESLEALVASYLSERHRADQAHGCAIAALGSEIARRDARQTKGVRSVLTAQLRMRIAHIVALLRGGTAASRRKRAIASMSGMVGALVLSRAVDDPVLAKEILVAGREAFGGRRGRGISPGSTSGLG
jgi:TetR/AcrR family transcriptional repressor of nem operon